MAPSCFTNMRPRKPRFGRTRMTTIFRAIANSPARITCSFSLPKTMRSRLRRTSNPKPSRSLTNVAAPGKPVVRHARPHTGWSVAVSLVAPFAAIALSGNPVNADDDFREVHGQRLFQRLEKLRSRIGGILEKHGVMVLPEMEWRQVVPWLRSDGSPFVGDAVNQPIR